ncbi:hypothetical protein ACFLSF_00170 [Candidatus Bipolaricaulota bacterium]
MPTSKSAFLRYALNTGERERLDSRTEDDPVVSAEIGQLVELEFAHALFPLAHYLHWNEFRCVASRRQLRLEFFPHG